MCLRFHEGLPYSVFAGLKAMLVQCISSQASHSDHRCTGCRGSSIGDINRDSSGKGAGAGWYVRVSLLSIPSSTSLTKCPEGMLVLSPRDSSTHSLVSTTLRASTVTWLKRRCDVKTHE